jgi:hypothetical protein
MPLGACSSQPAVHTKKPGIGVPAASPVTCTHSRSAPVQSATVSQNGLQPPPTHSVPALHSVAVEHG